MRLPIIVSAILPLIVAPESNGWVGAVVGITTWLVFLADYLVHARHLEHYGRTGFGRFDLFVVIATAPWFLLPGAQAGGFVVLLRLARLARLAMASKGSRRLFDRLGKVAIVAGGVLVTGSLVAYYAEHPVHPGFATAGDALWSAASSPLPLSATGTSPPDPTGRLAGVAIMITGIAVLGMHAGSLASFFRLDDAGDAAGSPAWRAGQHWGHVHRRPACGPGRRGGSPPPPAGGPDRAVDRNSPGLTSESAHGSCGCLVECPRSPGSAGCFRHGRGHTQDALPASRAKIVARMFRIVAGGR